MSDSTFEIFDNPTPAEPAIQEIPISSEDVARIRAAFAEAGILTMNERKALIQSCTVRPIANIRELLARDVARILKRIGQKQEPAVVHSGSAWDNREEDTWIDRM